MDDRIDGRYRILDELGSGGSGTVYRVEDERAGTTVALKVLAYAGERQREKLLRFRREFRAAAALEHPNVVRVHDFVAGRLSYFTMEWIDGVDIASYFGVGGRGARPPVNSPGRHDRLVAALGQMFDALDYIHERQIVHRDLKPENVLVIDAPAGGATAPLVKIMDFGLARDLRDATTLTQPGVVLGTLAYVSPEQASMRVVDGRADLYASGVLLYRLLTGTLPFTTDTVSAMLWEHCSQEPEAPHRRNPEVDRQLERICLRLLRKDPFERFQRAFDVVRALVHATSTAPSMPDAVAGRVGAGSGSVRLFAPRHVGRDALVARLEAVVAASQPGAEVFVAGPGMGKSRLLTQVAAAPVEALARPLAIGFRPGPGGSEIDVRAGLVQLHRRLTASPAADVRVTLGAETWARLRALATSAPAPGWAAIRAVIDGLSAGRTLVVAADDLHHADAAARRLLGEVVGRNQLRLIGTAEETAAERLEAAIPGLVVTRLEALTHPFVALLVASMLGRDEAPPELVEAIGELSGGVPADVAEMVRLLTRERVVTPQGAGLRLDRSRLAELIGWARPLGRGAAGEALRRRLVDRSPAEQHLLELLAVLGRASSFEALLAVGQLDEAAAVDAVDALLKADLLLEIEPDGHLDLAGETVRVALIGGLTSERRRRIDDQVASVASAETDRLL